MKLMQSFQTHLQKLSILDTNDCSSSVTALFTRLKRFIGNAISPSSSFQRKDWKQACYEALAKEDDKSGLAIFVAHMEIVTRYLVLHIFIRLPITVRFTLLFFTFSISLEHILALLEVYCQQLWMQENFDSGASLWWLFWNSICESMIDWYSLLAWWSFLYL